MGWVLLGLFGLLLCCTFAGIVLGLTSALMWASVSMTPDTPENKRFNLRQSLRLLAMSLILLSPVIALLVARDWSRRLPNGYRVVLNSLLDGEQIIDRRRFSVIPEVSDWEVEGDLVRVTTVDGKRLLLDTRPGAKPQIESK
ncbi:hypothetical protein [Planctomicrobium piriforme]|uniref:Uncharacterized protein n=1 Tax=Planctomicrobium piriforme TaxID=1576369 RepID=A0A1I3QSP7_9PLAN|nr:hypothetical protein [Planctomicrobium piriforme]SFJ36915.1 hypothetical protein SAMN05421753_11929 [Planctomicrobium piriforme]